MATHVTRLKLAGSGYYNASHRIRSCFQASALCRALGTGKWEPGMHNYFLWERSMTGQCNIAK